MKILQINAVKDFGSTGRIMTELHENLKKNGYESVIAYAEGEVQPGDYLIGNKFDRKIHAILSRITGLQGYFSYIETRKLIKFIKKENPDIVRLANLHGNFINIKYLLKYFGEKNIPTILTLDDCFYYTGKCCHYTIDNCYKWRYGCNNCKRLKKDNKSWFWDRTFKMWSDKKNLYEKIDNLTIIGVSDWIVKEAKDSILSSSKRIIKIYNWIDMDIFKKIQRIEEFESGKFYIIGVASKWNESKGLKYFLEISKYLNNDERIILIGKIDRKIVLPSNISIYGQISNQEVLARYYASADVMLQLSQEETFGKVVAESLACGTPVITTKSTANPELINEECGIVLDQLNAENIIDAIRSVKEKKSYNYSKKCRKFACENFDKNKLIKEYINLFEEIAR